MNKDQFADLLNSRHSHRKFSDEAVSADTIKEIIDIARIAPSGHNSQPWKFTAVINKDVINKLAETCKNNMEKVYKQLPDDFAEKLKKFEFFVTHFKDSPAVIAVLTEKVEIIEMDPSIKYDVTFDKPDLHNMEFLDIGAVTQNILLTAQAMGYASCWMTAPVAYAQKDMEKILNVEKGYNIVSLVALGKETKERTSPSKKPVDDILTIIE